MEIRVRGKENSLGKFAEEEAIKIQSKEERGYGRFGWKEYALLAGTALIVAGALLYFKWCVDYGADQAPGATARTLKDITRTFAGEKK